MSKFPILEKHWGLCPDASVIQEQPNIREHLSADGEENIGPMDHNENWLQEEQDIAHQMNEADINRFEE